MTRLLHELAHARAGDKGTMSDIAVIAYDLADYELLRRVLTPERVKAHFRGIVHGEVERYELPLLGALNFVLHDALAGGVTRSLRLDPHGKSLSSWMLTLDLDSADAVYYRTNVLVQRVGVRCGDDGDHR